jgi:mono/diheme cytochrome c family protein
MPWFDLANSEWRIANSKKRTSGRRANRPTRYSLLAIRYSLVEAALAAATSAALAQSPSSFSSSPFRFTHRDGEAIYRTVCAGCHMPDGRGAAGAGAYPALARNAKLEAAGYPVSLVVNGQKAMPAFGTQLDDNQVAAVVNYVRGNFGNAYADRVSADDVKATRQ